MTSFANQFRLYASQLGHFLLILARRFAHDRCPREAGALAFTTVLAIVPLTTVSIAMLSIFPVFETWMASAQGFIYGNFVATSGDMVSRYLQQFAASAGKLTAAGLVFLFVTAILLISTIDKAFNDIWHVRRKRKLSRRITTYWAVLTLGPLLIGMSLTTTSYLASLLLFSQQPALTETRQALLKIAPIIFEIAAFLLLYMAVPNCTVRARHALVGAGVATLLFEISKRLFGGYVTSFSTYQVIYGAVAALPVFLIWIYLSWVITLLGAEVTAALPQWNALARHVKLKTPGSGSVRTRK